MSKPLAAVYRRLKAFAPLLATGVLLAVIGVDSRFLVRVVTDLTVKGLSLNEIREHLRLIYSLDVTKHELQKIRYKAAQKAKEVNHELDREVAPKIHTMEGDEIFQGENIILGAADEPSAYVLGIKSAPDRTEASIATFFRPIAKMCVNVRVVITDLFRPYVEVVKVLFVRAIHLLCHVHAIRAVDRQYDKLKADLRRAKRLVDEGTPALDRATRRAKAASTKQEALAAKIQDLEGKVAALEEKKQAARGGRTKTVDKQLASAQARLARLQDTAQVLAEKLAKLAARRDKLAEQVENGPAKVKELQNDVLQSGRLAKKLYDLLNDRSRKFDNHKNHLLGVLRQSRASMAPYLAKFTEDHPQLFSLRKARDLAPNFQNTNIIEGIFGLFRPLLDSTRLIQTPAGINAYGELFRLYHNTTPPYTGLRNNTSPVDRLGVKLHGKTYLDLLFPARGRVTRILVGTLPTAPDETVRARALPGPACEVLSC